MNQKHALIVSNLFSAGTIYGGVCKELAIRLSEQGWHIITTSASKNRYLRPLDMLLTALTNRKNYQVAQIDVFSGPAFRWAETTGWLLRKLDKPYVLTLHGGNLPDFSSKYPARVRSLLNSAHYVTTPSRYLLETMQTYREDICLIPNPIDTQPYPFRLRSTPKPNLLYLRAFHRMYNPTLAVSTIQCLLNTHPTATLTMVGPDKGDGSLRELHEAVDKSALHNHINIIGAVAKSDVPNAMNQADVFINTTNVDNTPISIIEAMACGLCIVSTNVGGIPYLLEYEHDALLVPPNDPEAMANAIHRILTEPGLAARLSRNARAKAESFDWSIILPQWETLLTDIIQRHQRGRYS